MDDGLRPCAQGTYCASATLDTDTETGEKAWIPARGPRAFCSADRAKIAAALSELPRMYVSLSSELGTPVRRESMIHTVFGPKVPLRGDVDEIMHSYAEILSSWHERVAAVASLAAPPARSRQAPAVARALEVLSAEGRLDVLLALPAEPMRRAITYRQMEEAGDIDGTVRAGYVASTPELDGGDAGLEILRLHRRSRAILGETREKPVELLGVPCRVPECNYLALQRAELPSDPSEDGPWSICAECGDVMDETTYREWVALCAAYERNRANPAA